MYLNRSVFVMGGFNRFYWYQLFTLGSKAVKIKALEFSMPLKLSPFSVFSRITAWVTLNTQRCRFGAFNWSIHIFIRRYCIQYAYNLIQKFEFFFFFYSFYKHQCEYD